MTVGQEIRYDETLQEFKTKLDKYDELETKGRYVPRGIVVDRDTLGKLLQDHELLDRALAKLEAQGES